MKLTNKSIQNSISDARYRFAVIDMQLRQADEYEDVHNGSGRSEELPTDLAHRHAQERLNLAKDRAELSIMEWVRFYGNAVAEHPDHCARK